MALITVGKDAVACAFFYGRVLSVDVDRVGGVLLRTRESVCRLVSSGDEGLRFLPPGKKRLVVIACGRIKAIYIRPRISLFQGFGAGLIPSYELLKHLKPRYIAVDNSLELIFRRCSTQVLPGWYT